MAWGTLYKQQFYDRLNVKWEVYIREWNYGGAVNTIEKGSGNPLRIEAYGEDDILGQNILGSKATMEWWSYVHFEYSDLFLCDDFEYKVSIFRGGVLHWNGFIIPNQYREPYDHLPVLIKMTANDGLGLLKKHEFDDLGYSTRETNSKIVFDMLALVGISGFREYNNIYEDRMAVTTDDSPLDQIDIDTDLFIGKTCYEVLDIILKKSNSVIRQDQGVFTIFRIKEVTGATMYGRIFTSAVAKTSVSKTPLQYINRSAQSSNFHDHDGGIISTITQAKKISLHQDYGNKQSWIENWQFKAETFSGGDFEFWTAAAANMDFVGNALWLENEKRGVVLPCNSTAYSKKISQEFGTFIIESATDILWLEFDYLFCNYYDGQVSTVILSLEIKDVANNKYLYIISGNFTQFCGWQDTQAYVYLSQDVAAGVTDWQHFKRSIVGLPIDGKYKITLYSAYSVDAHTASVIVGFRDIRFYTTSSTISYITKTRSFWQRIAWSARMSTHLRNKYYNVKVVQDNEEIVEKTYLPACTPTTGDELEFNQFLGDVIDADIDNIVEQFAGALSVILRRTLAVAAAAFVTDHAADYSGGGVVVTQGVGAHTDDIIFTSDTAGVDFTGSTTITNTSGNLSGSVVNTQPNIVGQVQKDFIHMLGTSGTGDITINELTKEAVWQGSASATWDKFITDWAAAYDAVGVIITKPGLTPSYLKCEEKVIGGGFTDITKIEATSSPGLYGTVNEDAIPVPQDPIEAQKRIDTITLTGSSGTANILCDSVTEEVTVELGEESTAVWNSYDGTHTSNAEAKPLLEIIGDEIANQYSRQRQYIDTSIREMAAASFLSLTGNIQDVLNQHSGNNRIFIVAHGNYNARYREWEVTLCEIIN